MRNVKLDLGDGVYDEASEVLRKAAPTFARIKRDDRHHVRYDVKNGRVLDLATLAFALTDTNHSVVAPQGSSNESRASQGFIGGVLKKITLM